MRGIGGIGVPLSRDPKIKCIKSQSNCGSRLTGYKKVTVKFEDISAMLPQIHSSTSAIKRHF